MQGKRYAEVYFSIEDVRYHLYNYLHDIEPTPTDVPVPRYPVKEEDLILTFHADGVTVRWPEE